MGIPTHANAAGTWEFQERRGEKNGDKPRLDKCIAEEVFA
jgi:hypothetical protein